MHFDNFIKQRIELERTFFPQGMSQNIIQLFDKMGQLQREAYQAGYRAAELYCSQSWSNQSALGYVIMAAERIGISTQEIQRLVRAMDNRFDMKTLVEAAEHYRQSPY